ncbi:MAG: hypothetical protein FVQ83_11765 [Chloroflexi bacterium]|nr:hypothetical protein [Chloroflexota bacterium]
MDKNKRLKYLGIFILISFTLFAGIINYGAEIDWVVDIFAPKYRSTLGIFNRMTEEEIILKDTDPGFEEVLALFWLEIDSLEYFHETIIAGIVNGIQISLDPAYQPTLVDGVEVDSCIVSFKNNDEEIGSSFGINLIAEKREQIYELYLDQSLHDWSYILFVHGLVISFGLFYWASVIVQEDVAKVSMQGEEMGGEEKDKADKKADKEFLFWWVYASVIIMFVQETIYLFGYTGIYSFLYLISFGLIQWLILRRRFPSAWLWLPTTLIGGLLVYLFQFNTGFILEYIYSKYGESMNAWTSIIPTTFVFAFSMALFGLAQWVYLRRYFIRAKWWIVGIFGGTFIGQLLVYYILVLLLFDIENPLWTYQTRRIFETFIYGMITGYVLVIISRYPKTNESVLIEIVE